MFKCRRQAPGGSSNCDQLRNRWGRADYALRESSFCRYTFPRMVSADGTPMALPRPGYNKSCKERRKSSRPVVRCHASMACSMGKEQLAGFCTHYTAHCLRSQNLSITSQSHLSVSFYLCNESVLPSMLTFTQPRRLDDSHFKCRCQICIADASSCRSRVLPTSVMIPGRATVEISQYR